jgi:glycosyltransferase involved in cell wall biosynthesis
VRLVFLTQVFDAGDAVLGFVPRWIEGLARRVERVRVVALEVGDSSGLPANVDVRAIGRRGTLSRWLRYKRVLREAVAGEGFDAVLAHMVPRYLLVAERPARARGAGLYLWYTHGGVDARLRRAVRAADKVFTASEASLRLEAPNKVVTGHGIDLEHFARGGEAPATPPRVLCVGRLTPAKDPLTLLAAAAILRSRGLELAVDLVGGALAPGDEAYLGSVREQIELGGLNGCVQLHGPVPYREIPALYRRASLLASPSRTGSVDKVVLEAMACERPAVTCNEAFAPLFAELGERDAQRLQFRPGSAGDLAERLQALLAAPQAERDALGARSRALVAEHHEVEQLCERLVREMGGAR